MSIKCIIGMSYGDESKGQNVSYLCKENNATLVVKFNGTANSGHNVHLSDGRHHEFSQFGAGSFIPGVKTHLSKYCLVNPLNQMREADALISKGVPDIWERLTVHEDAVIITPWHRLLNEIVEEAHGEKKSTRNGLGIARHFSLEYPEETLLAKDLTNPEKIKRFKEAFLSFVDYTCNGLNYTSHQFNIIRTFSNHRLDITFDENTYKTWPAKLVSKLVLDENTIFEGCQGVLLDEKYGFAPYNTWTDCTFGNALKLISEAGYTGNVEKIGCFRSYFTRHGAGPFPTEWPMTPKKFQEVDNITNPGQGKFKTGGFDWNLAQYAIEIAKPDSLFISHLDINYLELDQFRKKFKVPVRYIGWGNTAAQRTVRCDSFTQKRYDK